METTLQKINIKENVLLSPFTTFKIGGPARFFVEVETEKELVEAISFSQKTGEKVFILGGGSNILISDKGFDGLVIKMSNSDYEFDGIKVKCGAGVLLSKIINEAAEKELIGLEWGTGIPGITVGGAIRGNAGAFGKEIAELVEKVRVFSAKEMKFEEFSKENCQFSYRNSIFKEKGSLIIISAILKLKRGEKETILELMRKNVEKRESSYPQGYYCAGSFFENPETSNKNLMRQFEDDKGVKCKDSKLPAGWLIAEAGLKGYKVGRVKVSEKHGNFLVNTGGGTAEDIIILSSIIKQKVREKFGVQLKEEVKLVGF